MSENVLYKKDTVIWVPGAEGADVTSRHDQRKIEISGFPDVKAQVDAYREAIKKELEVAMKRIESHALVADILAEDTVECIRKARSEIKMLLFFTEAEGLTNAWKHGNKCNPAKPMYWETALIGTKENWRDVLLRFRIGDVGEGFPDSAVPRTEELRHYRDEVEQLEGGRGVIMMEAFTDTCSHDIHDVDIVGTTTGELYRSMHVLELDRFIFKKKKPVADDE